MSQTRREAGQSQASKLLRDWDVKKRELLVTGHLDISSSLAFLASLQCLEVGFSLKPVRLIINSCSGGDWVSVRHMYANLRSVPFPIFTTAKNFVASGALLLFAAGVRRFAHRGTELGFHVPLIGFEEPNKFIDTDFKCLYDAAYQINQEYYRLVTEAFGLEEATWQVRKWCEEERIWVLKGKGAEEALRLGIVHEIINK